MGRLQIYARAVFLYLLNLFARFAVNQLQLICSVVQLNMHMKAEKL